MLMQGHALRIHLHMMRGQLLSLCPLSSSHLHSLQWEVHTLVLKSANTTGRSMRTMFEVTLYKRGTVHVLADDVEDAAWQAVHICEEEDDLLLDVVPLNETP